MPTLPRNTLLRSYAYDPLDRLVSSAQPSAAPLRQFHCKDRLATQIQGTESHSIVQHLEYLLAQQHRRDAQVGSRLMATDQQRSVLSLHDSTEQNFQAYSPFGHCERVSGQLGFNGEPPDPLTRHYALGNGYRTYNPWLMRFQSPDNVSPFGDGGLNCYGYCVGDPINRTDPTGHVATSIGRLLKLVSNNKVLATTGIGGGLIAGASLFVDPEKNPGLADAMLGVSAALVGFSVLVGGAKLGRHIGSRRRGAAAGQSPRPLDSDVVVLEGHRDTRPNVTGGKRFPEIDDMDSQFHVGHSAARRIHIKKQPYLPPESADLDAVSTSSRSSSVTSSIGSSVESFMVPGITRSQSFTSSTARTAAKLRKNTV